MSAENGRIQMLERAQEMGIYIPKEVLDNFKTEDTENIKSVDHYRQALIEHRNAPQGERGLKLPWQKTHDFFRVRGGELTIWSGVEGNGKSAFLNMVNLAIAAQGQTSCICSFEMQPIETLERMLCQWVGNPEPSDEYVARFFDSHVGSIFLYDKTGSITPHRVINIAKYCAVELKLQHIFIDSLMKCGINSKNLEEGEMLLNELQNVAKDYGIHVHIVMHQKKGGDHGREQDQIRGSGMFSDIADNIWFVRMDEKKAEKKTLPEGHELALTEEEDKTKPDFIATLAKQRHSRVIVPRKFGFWGDDSWQFKSSKTARRLNPDDWNSGRFI